MLVLIIVTAAPVVTVVTVVIVNSTAYIVNCTLTMTRNYMRNFPKLSAKLPNTE